ncbi:UDP-N-acetylglucosamine--N-acetylmuramyl-(pentapeptide) pyrophosphoryl-undecaprenol N-acetylglucosamine transferase [Streptococcus pneumoniae GA13338]|nr:UDP-N-acetylglucosamine--N-acetylmuramyl-(pentapeptide) pyrophosphoryl-undecaprenol N-acetylglucosamine transferase [Streptococcus pneumoniae GA13338]EHZ24428.1 glycosyltransferase family 28 N-terminal domain protein [Streptococcus pneumoniae GA13723]
MKKIVFTGGGTVGHVTLNLLLMPKFIEDGWEVHYIGDKRGIEHQEILKSGLDVTFHSIATGKLRRYFSWQNMLDVFKVGWGIVQSLFIMLRLRPQTLFSKGGFVSVPPVIAARVSGVPVFIHESDLSMGLANKIAYKFATKMYSTFEQASSLAKVEHVGAVTKVSDQKIQNQMNWWIFKATLIINCRLYCLLAVLQVLVSLTNW